MTALAVAAYLLIGAFTAWVVGRDLVAEAQRARRLGLVRGLDRSSALFMAVAIGLAWPLWLAWGAITWTHQFFLDIWNGAGR